MQKDYSSTGLFLTTVLIAFGLQANCQTILNPNSGLKSHETLVIKSIEFKKGRTLVSMEIENRIPGGNFCADRDIYIIDEKGNKLRLIRSQDIPVCPDTHLFKTIGEKLSFTLEFPPLPEGSQWIDIIEDCSENCFWFFGIVLDAKLNIRLDDLFTGTSTANPETRLRMFRELITEIDADNNGIEGLLFINIIMAARDAGDNTEAAVWYKRLAVSGAPRKDYYLKYLNQTGIKY